MPRATDASQLDLPHLFCPPVIVPQGGGEFLVKPGKPIAKLTPLEDWEAAMRRGDCKAIVLWPRGVSEEQGQAAAWWWQTHCYGSTYDAIAIRQLAWRWAAEAFGNKLGEEDKFYCTESCHAAYSAVISPPGSPWWPKNLNPTPGTTRKRTLQGRFDVRLDAFTEEGLGYGIWL